MGCGLERRCVGCVYGADGAVRRTDSESSCKVVPERRNNYRGS